jgi:hypothetical protein
MTERFPNTDTPRPVMSGKRTFIAIATALGVIGAASMASAQQGGPDQGGAVQPCSLSGINPADHPNIFGNPQVATEQYGFVRGPDGSWAVMPNCESQLRR